MVEQSKRIFLAPQKIVDSIGMYRVVSGALFLLAAISIIFGFVGLVPYSPLSQLFSLATALGVALGLNVVTAWACKIPANHESAVITSLILFFLVIPAESLTEIWPLLVAVAIAIMSKYILVYKKQHLLNPAAVGAAALSLPGFYVFSWWVGNPALFIPLFILGVLVVMKVRKWTPVLWFVGVSFVVYLFETIRFDLPLLESVQVFVFSWPTLFLAFFMLTEPFTMPPTKKTQALYGALVGFLSHTALFVPFVRMTPELALIIGNAVVAPTRLTQKLYLKLESKTLVAKDTYEFVFSKPSGFSFIPGQYLEWMLPHKSDEKGNRRYFTIASSPTERVIRVAMKFPPKPSSYKMSLQSLDLNQEIIASQLAGDFLLPKDTATKIGFIAGGIGVTPFRSHIKYMIDSGNYYDTSLYYCNNTVAEIAYGDLFVEAYKIFSCNIIHVISKEEVEPPFEKGYLTKEVLERHTPDYASRVWYISGPPHMVDAYKALLRSMGVKRTHIKTDFFPGAV